MKLMKQGFFLFFSLFLFANISYAHEKREVGAYKFVVGFVNEPAYSEQFNGLDLKIFEKEKPVEGLEKTLNVTVFRDSEQNSMPLTLKKRYKEPGVYAAYFFPTKPGSYSFRITGTIADQKIDELFVAGEGKFHEIEDIAALKFPKA